MVSLVFFVLMIFAFICILFGITGLAGVLIGMVIPLTFITAMQLIGFGLCLFAIAIFIMMIPDLWIQWMTKDERKVI